MLIIVKMPRRMEKNHDVAIPVAPRLTVLMRTSARAGVAASEKDARAVSVVPSETAAHETRAVRTCPAMVSAPHRHGWGEHAAILLLTPLPLRRVPTGRGMRLDGRAGSREVHASLQRSGVE
jgi:hypothetical protein